MGYLIDSRLKIWRVTNTKLARCVLRGKRNVSVFAKKIPLEKKFNKNPFSLHENPALAFIVFLFLAAKV